MKRTVLEADLRFILRDESRFPFGTVSFCEFARGGDPGFPDSMIAGPRHWIPTELKRGGSVVKNLRPTQRRWHRTSLELGIPTYGMSISLNGKQVLVFSLGLDSGGLNEYLIEAIEPEELELRRFLSAIGM